MIKYAYIALLVGLILELVIKAFFFKGEYLDKSKKHSKLYSAFSIVILTITEILATGGAGLIGIEIFLK